MTCSIPSTPSRPLYNLSRDNPDFIIQGDGTASTWSMDNDLVLFSSEKPLPKRMRHPAPPKTDPTHFKPCCPVDIYPKEKHTSAVDVMATSARTQTRGLTIGDKWKAIQATRRKKKSKRVRPPSPYVVKSEIRQEKNKLLVKCSMENIPLPLAPTNFDLQLFLPLRMFLHATRVKKEKLDGSVQQRARKVRGSKLKKAQIKQEVVSQAWEFMKNNKLCHSAKNPGQMVSNDLLCLQHIDTDLSTSFSGIAHEPAKQPLARDNMIKMEEFVVPEKRANSSWFNPIESSPKGDVGSWSKDGHGQTTDVNIATTTKVVSYPIQEMSSTRQLRQVPIEGKRRRMAFEGK
ncbi:Aste57867_2773 [Aphanomyces stellatus]|uniref:Aste57867_2773 protein n=1 Tax=Aphanomyces stellatus TaxID=120398 RepID=A0A485K8B8_9STRA|nr:hypothetical protein As57867_002766 [Aphanomyces stellatus]VFT79963.1 Aste57867_2773 [Aphanomyces stellatus]